jgi:hypothetical protein
METDKLEPMLVYLFFQVSVCVFYTKKPNIQVISLILV